MEYRLEESLGYLVNRASRTIRACWDRELRLKKARVTGEQFSLLVHLWHQDGRHQQQLADTLGKDKTTLARLIRSVEKQGLVKRERRGLDDRHKLVSLTRKGRHVMNRTTRLAQQLLTEAESGILPEEMAVCKNVLRKVSQTMRMKLLPTALQEQGRAGGK